MLLYKLFIIIVHVGVALWIVSALLEPSKDNVKSSSFHVLLQCFLAVVASVRRSRSNLGILKFIKYIPFSLCFLLTACGFRPLYTPHQGRAEVAYPIKIATIFNREGQILRNYLLDLLTPGGIPQCPRYILEITLTDTIRTIGVNKDETTTRSEVILTAVFVLKDAKTNSIVYRHRTKAINSFSILTQNYYADLVAEEYAKKEAARLLAEKIMLLITTYIDTHE